MSKYIDALIERRNLVVTSAQDIMDKAADESRDITEEERARVDGYNKEAETLEAQIVDFTKAEDRAAKFAETFSGRRATAEVREREQRRDAVENPEDDAKPDKPDTRSVGQRFIESEAFLNYKGRGSSAAVEFSDFLGVERREAIKSTDLNVLPYQYTGAIGYVTTTPFLDAIGREVVNSNSVTYIDWGGSDPLAGGPIAEGELKPEAVITPSEVPLVIETYAHWKAVTRQALEDYPRIQSIIEGKLRGGLADKLEQVAAGVLTGADNIANVTNADLLAGIREAVGQIQADGFQPNAVVLNPADYASLDIAAAASSNSGPTAFGTFWGLRPIAAGAVPEGTAYVGDFKQGVTWFDRNVTSVFMTDSHADYFIRNLLVVLAEARSAFAVTDPLALAQVTTVAPAVARTAKSTASK